MKKFFVNVRWGVEKTYVVEAEDEAEALNVMNQHLDNGEISYFDDGYEAADSDAEVLSDRPDDDEYVDYSQGKSAVDPFRTMVALVGEDALSC